jgi:hypothetical protein
MTLRLGIGIICGLFLSTLACTRTVHVTERMTWECAPDEYKPAFYARPDEYVRFRYVANPRCFEVESARDLCSTLSKAGNAVVNVEFEVWGKGHSIRGYRMLSVDGHALQDVGGWGNSGSNDAQQPCPISNWMGAGK